MPEAAKLSHDVCLVRFRKIFTLASREKDTIRFEEEPPPVVMGLQLDHD